MAKKKISLREFQEGVVARLQLAKEAGASAVSSKLGVKVGGQSWLVNLNDVSEVVPLPEVVPVPLTHPWFKGVSNVRGNLYGIVDFSAFLGGDPVPPGIESRLLLINPRYAINCGLVINHMLGLRSPNELQSKDSTEGSENDSGWVAKEYTDKDGSAWKELNMQHLVNHPDFLRVGL